MLRRFVILTMVGASLAPGAARADIDPATFPPALYVDRWSDSYASSPAFEYAVTSGFGAIEVHVTQTATDLVVSSPNNDLFRAAPPCVAAGERTGACPLAAAPVFRYTAPTIELPSTIDVDPAVTVPVILRGSSRAPDALRGGAADDVLVGERGSLGGAPPDRLEGRGGDDTLALNSGGEADGGPGDDVLVGPGVLRGDDGDDQLSGATRAEGGAGDDQITSAAVADGGPGDDRIEMRAHPGPGAASGGPGNDEILAENGVAETIDCGPGDDTVTHDAADTVVGCEHDLDAVPILGYAGDDALRVGPRRTLGVALECAGARRAPVCAGHLRVLAHGRVLGERDVRVRPGATLTVRVPLRARELRRLGTAATASVVLRLGARGPTALAERATTVALRLARPQRAG